MLGWLALCWRLRGLRTSAGGGAAVNFDRQLLRLDDEAENGFDIVLGFGTVQRHLVALRIPRLRNDRAEMLQLFDQQGTILVADPYQRDREPSLCVLRAISSRLVIGRLPRCLDLWRRRWSRFGGRCRCRLGYRFLLAQFIQRYLLQDT